MFYNTTFNNNPKMKGEFAKKQGTQKETKFSCSLLLWLHCRNTAHLCRRTTPCCYTVLGGLGRGNGFDTFLTIHATFLFINHLFLDQKLHDESNQSDGVRLDWIFRLSRTADSVICLFFPDLPGHPHWECPANDTHQASLSSSHPHVFLPFHSLFFRNLLYICYHSQDAGKSNNGRKVHFLHWVCCSDVFLHWLWRH